VIVYTESTSLENKKPDIIFVATMKDMQKQLDGNELITFRVKYMEKGTRINEITVISINTKKECSLNFELAIPYMVYAVLEDGQYVTNSCLGTQVYILRGGSVSSDRTVYPIPLEEPNWKTYHAIGKYLNSNPPKPDQVFNIKYRAINGVIESFEESGQGSFLAQVNSVNNGKLEILFPRNYPYTNGYGEGHGKSFTVFNHNEPQKDYEVKLEKTDCFFEYSIPFTGNQRLGLGFISITVATPFHGDEVPTNCINETIYLPPPLKQFKSGIALDDIKCKENYQKVFKIKEGSPACVKPTSIPRLEMQGWSECCWSTSGP